MFAACAAIALALALAAGSAQQAQAAPITWIGGNADWDATNANWNPADEPDANDEAIFNTPNTVNMANATETIQELTLSSGIDLNTNGTNLTVDGLVELVDASTTFIIGGNTSLVQADSVNINNGGTIRLTGGTLTIREETNNGRLDVNAFGTLTGHGTINLNDVVAPGALPLMLLSFDATLTATSNTPGDPFGSVAATLTINLADADARVSFSSAAEINISRNDTLEINGRAHDPADFFRSTLNLAAGSTLDMSVAWQAVGATINVNTTGLTAGSAGPAATIAGADFTLGNGVTINLDAIDSLRFTAPFTATTFSTAGGTINNAGLIIFDSETTIGAVTDFQMTGANASLTVSAGRTVNIDDADFNPDGAGAATNIITIGDGGILDLDLGAGADESLDGVINLNGGELDVTTQSNSWAISGDVNVTDAVSNSQINGEKVTFTSTTVTVGANALLDVNAPSEWGPTGNLVINAGATAELDGSSVTFLNAGTFTGTGTLRIGGGGVVSTETTFDMPNGTVDLDGGDFSVNSIVFDRTLTINVGTMASFGNTVADTLNFAPLASLEVNLTDPNAEWTIASNAVVTFAGSSNTFGDGIQGSDVNVAGTVNISANGNSNWGARVDLTGTVNIALNGSWFLRGGTLTDMNRLIGGTITGDGALRAFSDEALAGFGTIATDIRFLANTMLLADDGTLNVNAPILDVGTIGTADADGILNVTVAWNTNVTNEVNLRGGELRGATITNAGAGGISGFGLLAAPVINTTLIDAENGTLVVQTAGNNNDWDGNGGNGQLRAILGNLEIRDNATFLFTGNVVANQDHEVFVNGFELEFEPASNLTLGSGTFRSTNATDFGGTLTVLPPVGGSSALRGANAFTFEQGSATSLNGNLLLDIPTTIVRPGAFFIGPAALVNAPTRTLRLLHGVLSGDLTVLVRNEGVLQVGSFGTGGEAQAGAFAQTATGTLQLEIGGTTPGSGFDTLAIAGNVTLDGTLDVSLFGGFTPAAGDVFDLLDWAGTLTGTFDELLLPPGSWDTSQLYQTGELRFVPEPGTAAFLALGLTILCRRSPR